MTLTFDLLTSIVVSESHVTWATSMPILVSVLDLGPMYETDVRRQTDRRLTASSHNAPAKGAGHNNVRFPARERPNRHSCVSLILDAWTNGPVL